MFPEGIESLNNQKHVPSWAAPDKCLCNAESQTTTEKLDADKQQTAREKLDVFRRRPIESLHASGATLRDKRCCIPMTTATGESRTESAIHVLFQGHVARQGFQISNLLTV